MYVDTVSSHYSLLCFTEPFIQAERDVWTLPRQYIVVVVIIYSFYKTMLTRQFHESCSGLLWFSYACL